MKQQFLKKAQAVLCLLLSVGLTLLSSKTVQAAPDYKTAVSWDASADTAAVLSYGMTPIDGQLVEDGTYDVNVRSSSRYFRLNGAVLRVENGEMRAEVHFDSLTYPYVYPGSPSEAASAPPEDYLECTQTENDTVFRFPVEALNVPLPCAAYSKNRNQWYGRMLLFEAASLPPSALNTVLPDYQLIESALREAGEDPAELLEFALVDVDTEPEVPAGQPSAMEEVDEFAEHREATKKVLMIALGIIVIGGAANHIVQKKREV